MRNVAFGSRVSSRRLRRRAEYQPFLPALFHSLSTRTRSARAADRRRPASPNAVSLVLSCGAPSSHRCSPFPRPPELSLTRRSSRQVAQSSTSSSSRTSARCPRRTVTVSCDPGDIQIEKCGRTRVGYPFLAYCIQNNRVECIARSVSASPAVSGHIVQVKGPSLSNGRSLI